MRKSALSKYSRNGRKVERQPAPSVTQINSIPFSYSQNNSISGVFSAIRQDFIFSIQKPLAFIHLAS